MTPAELAELLRSNPDLRAANAPARQAPPVLTLPYPPSVNHYWRHAGHGRMVLTDEAAQYKADVSDRCTQYGLQPHDGPVGLRIHVYRPIKRGDLDNTLKAALDSLKGFAYEDDAQVTEIHAFRHDDKGNPRIEVEVMRL